MDNCFEESEKLYRAVIPSGIFIKEDGTITSAAFKSSNGCSVDRGNYRTDDQAVQFLKNCGRVGAVYSVLTKDCNDKEIYINYEPEEDNPFHTGLYKNVELNPMTQGQCKHLSKVAILVSNE